MLTLFRYNWQVRDDWFRWCQEVPEDELLAIRTGGVGSILHTLFHVVEVERMWIADLTPVATAPNDFADFGSLARVMALSARCRPEVEAFVRAWRPELDTRVVEGAYEDGRPYRLLMGEGLRHVIAHEIHHMGQMSVWSRALGRAPVSANLVGRHLM